MSKFTKQKERKHKINSEVRFPEVRVIGDRNGELMSSFDAAKIAREEGKDLILINENAKPPVVRIEDYNKFLYETSKREKEAKKNSKSNDTKEIKLSANIADHDLAIKSKRASEFLKSGNRVKVTLEMRGREITMKEQSEMVVLKFIQSIEEEGLPESMPNLDGKRFILFVKPKKKS
jgi:translation initiation factor IF-3